MFPRLITIDPDGDVLIILQSTEEVQFKVSMKHLAMASRRAKVMFEGSYTESVPQMSDGLRHWRFEPIFNPEAFEIIMNIIHAQNHKLPDKPTLDMLAHIAAIVDDLACQNAVVHFATLWLHQINPRPPSYPCLKLSQLILISSVFRNSDLFRSSTAEAILSYTGHMSTYELPIRPEILSMIEFRRNMCLGSLIEKLHELGETLGNGKQCDFDCSSMMLGSLISHARKQKLWSPKPSKPFAGFSVSSLKKTLRTFDSPTLYRAQKEVRPGERKIFWRRTNEYVGWSHPSTKENALPEHLEAHDHTLKSFIQPLLNSDTWGLSGLELSCFTFDASKSC
ncbi:hypothetical protein PT974_12478 [Cladobotryum mycophilum]|uniref:BTB domain-containing protein n=1 Tax=Cladobotryum mycophilum TaxID=491253 RepID=A0ABR0S830_9HYPO